MSKKLPRKPKPESEKPAPPSGLENALQVIQIENVETAKFKCVFPVCGGICCKTGRPHVTEDDMARIKNDYEKFVPHMRPDVRRYLKRHHWTSNRTKQKNATLSVAGGYCVFYNNGCILQKVGMEEGEPWRYKPDVCIRFPIEPIRNHVDKYYIRQWDYRGEGWDLFCLNPAEDPTPASESLKPEIDYVAERTRKNNL